MRPKEKIKPIEQLAELLQDLRPTKKIVLCHGVFDLLHIGHIRHFEEAKQLGDVLVVTITPDQYVDKGPHRPAFPADLRAESIAALDCVDFVAVNKWPMAVETISLLKPHIYAKGADYAQAEKDRTGGIKLEEDAIRAAGGKIVFTNGLRFSASTVINRHLPIFPAEVSNYLLDFGARHRLDDVLNYVENTATLSVLVVGETIVDEYQYCEAIGKSSKEPMLAVKQLSVERFAGGILAVANHVANFSETVGLVSYLGTENSQEEFIHSRLNPKVRARTFLRHSTPTIVKRRFVESYFFTKLLDVYELNDEPLSEEENRELCRILEEQVPQYDLVIVVDFGHGMLSDDAIRLICDRAKFLAVNTQSNAGNLGYHTISRYPHADYVCMAENEIRLESRDRHGDLRPMMLHICEKLDCSRIAVTRGRFGCICYDREEGFSEVPAFAGRVVDRMGAGDAFLSITSLCVAQHAPMEVVGFIGNAVGAEAVATVGNREPIQRVSLLRHMESLLK